MRRFAAILIAAVACAHAPQKFPSLDAAAERQRLLELPPAALYKEARELMANGRWEAARARLEACLTRMPDSAAALFDAGWVEEQLGDGRSAAELYARALAIQPGHVGAARRLSRLQDSPAQAERI